MCHIKHYNLENGRKITVAGISLPTDNEMHFGIAVTRPGDTFLKKVGRMKAEGRAKSKNKLIVTFPTEHQGTPGKFFCSIADQLVEAKLEELYLREEAKKHR